MVTPSTALMILAFELEAAVKTASLPGTRAPQYRPAVSESVALARKLYREYEACCWKEDLKASAELAKQHPVDHYRKDTFVSSHARVTPGHYCGD